MEEYEEYKGLKWSDPSTWEEEISFDEFNHDFRCLLSDHGWIKPSYQIVKIKISDVICPTIDYDDDRDMDTETGEPSNAYLDSIFEAMKAGTPMPPILIGDDAGREGKLHGMPYDGRHRLHAASRLGLEWVPAIDLTGTPGDT